LTKIFLKLDYYKDKLRKNVPHRITLYLDTSIPSQLFQPPEWMKRATVRFYSEVIPKSFVTWNMQHLVKEPTQTTVAYVNYLFNLPPLNIVTPLDLLIGEE
jgi:hypothetical protein